MLDWFVTLRLLCIFEPEVELLRLLDIGCLFRAAYEYYGLDSLCFVFPSLSLVYTLSTTALLLCLSPSFPKNEGSARGVKTRPLAFCSALEANENLFFN